MKDPTQRHDYFAFQHRVAPEQEPNLIELTRASVFTTDLAGNVTTWNPGARRLTGYAAEEMLGRNIALLYPDEKLPHHMIPTLLKEGDLDIDVPLKRKDGTLSHVGLSLSVIPDKSGAPAGFVGVSIDVTNLKLGEVALKEANQLLDGIRHLQSLFISTRDVRSVLGEALSMLLAETNSEYGFLGEIVTGDPGRPHVRTYSIQTRSQNPEVPEFFQRGSSGAVEFHRAHSLIGYVVRHGEVVIANTPVSDRRSGGLPPGHPPLSSFMGVPLRARNGMLGMLALANRPGGYDEALVARIQPLLDCCSTFIEACQAQDKADGLTKMLQCGFARLQNALLISTSEGTVTDWNPEATKMFGYTKMETVGTNLAALFADPSELAGMLSSAARDGYCGREITLLSRQKGEVVTQTGVCPVGGGNGQAFMWVICDITWRKQAEQALQEASDRFEAFAQHSQTAFWMSSADGARCFYLSPAIEAITGRPVGAIMEREQWLELVHPNDRRQFLANKEIYFHGAPFRHKYRIIRPDGSIRWVQSDAFTVKDAKGEITCLAGLFEDVTDREEADSRLRRALEEKDALLKEVHHRVKNNLQIISSLLRLQGASATDPNSAAILRESRNRVQTIALLHEHLYQSDSASNISFPAYAKRLVDSLALMHHLQRDAVKVTLDIEPLTFDSQTAILCGLILNELVSNSLRHAFPAGRIGEIAIRSYSSGQGTVVLSVSDNGAGMPQDFDLQRVTTLGLQLVRRLTRQLKGIVSVSNRNGTTVAIEFPIQGTQRSEQQESS